MHVEAFEHFYRFMQPKLLRYAKRRLDSENAQDTVSQTMQTLWDKNIAEPCDDSEHRQLQSLAYRVVEGHIRNTLRSAYRRLKLVDSLEAERRTKPRHERDIADLVCAEPAEWIAKLSLTDREVLSLIADNFAVAEIALILDCTPAAVSMRLQRAKKNLRLILGTGAAHG